jgi:hypothetical protein
VLAPGYNAAHYDHIHVDLMRRANGRHPCRPDAIPGEVVAAKARAVYASKQRGPLHTGSIATRPVKPGAAPHAIPGEDGFVEDDGDDTVTGSIAKMPAKPNMAVPGADGEFDDDVTGSIQPSIQTSIQTWPRLPAMRRSGAAAAGDAAIRAEELRSKN